MTILEFFAQYWDSILVVAIIAALFIALAVHGEKEIINKIIFRTVTELEKQYGSGTGALKLAAAIDTIYPKLPAVLRYFITAETLQRWIEEGLAAAKLKWSQNIALTNYIGKPPDKTND